MPIKDILLLLETEGDAQVAAPYATALAVSLRAQLTVAGIAFEILAPASFTGDYPYDVLAAVTEQSRQRAKDAYDKLRVAAPDALASEFVQIDALPGEAREQFARLVRHFDLAVIGQGVESNSDDTLIAEAALFGSGRPVLVVPRIQKKPPSFDRALVAWDASRASARALADSLPLLMQAKTVEVVTVSDHRLSDKELPGFNITRHLARHGLNAELKRLTISGDIGETLLSYAADSGSDFLVMGGYGHSRLREFILGGTTRTIMKSMTIPVLMSH